MLAHCVNKIWQYVALWVLQLYGIPSKSVGLLTGLYSGTESSLKCWGELSSLYPVNTGVKKGYTLAPSLFNECGLVIRQTCGPKSLLNVSSRCIGVWHAIQNSALLWRLWRSPKRVHKVTSWLEHVIHPAMIYPGLERDVCWLFQNLWEWEAIPPSVCFYW